MKSLLLIVVMGLALLFAPAGVAEAKDNTVDVAVCTNGGSGSTITISQPISDTVVNQPVTTFRGSIANATQIEIRIDNDYVSTISIGSQQATYVTDVTLTKGTHTVKLIANDICQNSNGTASVVVTYEPTTNTSNGGLTPTDLKGGVAVGSGGGAGSQNPDPFRIEEIPVIGLVYKAVIELGALTGLNTTLGAGSWLVGLVRVVITIIALMLIIVPKLFFPVVVNYGPKKLTIMVKDEIHRKRRYLDWIFRGIGILLMILIYLS